MAVIFEVFFCKYTLFSVDFAKPLYNAQTLGAKKPLLFRKAAFLILKSSLLFRTP
jgi:hypothetical protein